MRMFYNATAIWCARFIHGIHPPQSGTTTTPLAINRTQDYLSAPPLLASEQCLKTVPDFPIAAGVIKNSDVCFAYLSPRLRMVFAGLEADSDCREKDGTTVRARKTSWLAHLALCFGGENGLGGDRRSWSWAFDAQRDGGVQRLRKVDLIPAGIDFHVKPYMFDGVDKWFDEPMFALVVVCRLALGRCQTALSRIMLFVVLLVLCIRPGVADAVALCLRQSQPGAIDKEIAGLCRCENCSCCRHGSEHFVIFLNERTVTH